MTDGFRVRSPASATLLALGILAGCASAPPREPWCESPELRVDAGFDGAGFHHCVVEPDGRVTISIRPEDAPPINPSPWYAFRLTPDGATAATVELTFSSGYARYQPKISSDGETFTPLPADVVERSADGQSMSFTVPLAGRPVRVTAQELLLPDDYAEWLRQLASRPGITMTTLGESVDDRPIHAVRTAARREAVLLLGRQHPPEVSGALAMRRFVDTVLADTPLAARFRDRYEVVVVPLINPDGVARGHWRHNVGGVDLNRDWGPFTQPETQSVAVMLDDLERAGTAPRLMLDFHSTRSSLFYTQMPDDSGEDFASVWLARSRPRAPEYDFSHEPRETSQQANAKNYFHRRYRIPSITYEVGDEADRDVLEAAAAVFAEEMMRLMLEIRGQLP